jgi:hypothetical protein
MILLIMKTYKSGLFRLTKVTRIGLSTFSSVLMYPVSLRILHDVALTIYYFFIGTKSTEMVFGPILYVPQLAADVPAIFLICFWFKISKS